MNRPRLATGPLVDLCLTFLSSHPYRDAILGDLAEGRADVEAAAGPAAAAAWHRREILRSAASLFVRHRVAPAPALRGALIALGVYAAAVRLPGLTVHALTRVAASSPVAFGPLYLAVIATSGAVAGWGARALGRDATATILLLAVAVAVGAVHIATAPPGEHGFRAAKVGIFLAAILVGSLRPGPSHPEAAA